MKWCLLICLTSLTCTSGSVQDGAAEVDKVTIVPLPQIPIERETNENDTDPNTRIIGGTDTTIERFPYTVQVQYDRRLACGGSLLTRRHVLSAAHCFFDSSGRPVAASRYTVRVGTARLESGGSVHSVSTYIVHENYNTPIRDNDIAIMVLSSRVSLGSRVALASILGQGVEVPDNSVVVHVGWGRTNVNVNQASPILQEVTIRTISFAICSQRYNWLSSMSSEQYVVTTNMICSGLLDIGGADACQGDSGGPLIFQGIVVGVTSWGYGCADPRFPGVNAKVSAYSNWINQTVTRYSAGPPSSVTSLFLITTSVLVSMFASR